MNHKQYLDAVHEYRLRSGHAINYYDGGAEKRTPGSLAKDKMRDLLARADGSVNRSRRRKSVLGEINDTQ